MSPPPTRRQLLTGLGGALGLGAVGSTVYHAYTGPLTLVVENYFHEPLTLSVRIKRDESLVHEATYDLPAFTPTDDPDTSGTGRVKEQIIDSTIRGTIYTVEASTEVHDGLGPREDKTYRVTCTGYTDFHQPDGGEKRVADRLFVAASPEPDYGITLGRNYCGNVWD